MTISKFVLNRLVFTTPAVIITIAIFILSNQPHLPQIDFGVEWGDKILHFFAYFCYGFSLSLAFLGNFQTWSLKKVVIIVLSIGFIYGVSDEIHQSFIPNRTADIYDWFADATGVCMSLSLIKLTRLIVKKFTLQK